MDGNPAPSATPKRKRASRKGLPRRFECHHEGCGKRYSRAEHLARHELNHTPKQIYRCDIQGCGHTFVRPDLFARHQRKHEESHTPGERSSSTKQRSQSASALPVSSVLPSPPASYYNTAQTSYIRSGSGVDASGSGWQMNAQPQLARAQSLDGARMAEPGPFRSIEPVDNVKNGFNDGNNAWLTTEQGGVEGYLGAAQSNENFAAWLFDSPGSQQQDFNLANLPFMDFGMQYSPNDIWNFDPSAAPLQTEPSTYSTQSSTITPENDCHGKSVKDGHFHVSDHLRERIVDMITSFWHKKRPKLPDGPIERMSVVFNLEGRIWPNITASMLESCLVTFWRDVSLQMPILHLPTFVTDDSNILLLLAMIALGASQMVRLSSNEALQGYRFLADLIAINLRWVIFTEDDAQPPVQLWVAQALLLVELYEKMYTTRQLHERAHIHHASTLTLLRRGSPLIGRADSETPSSEMPTRCGTPLEGGTRSKRSREPDSMRWWRRWAQNESMHRVVFAAFEMDILNAVMFGHDSVLFPYEIRLPLPCDDALWNAQSPEEVHRLEATFSMHGIKPINFLDGLKRCLHSHDVPSHQHARLILVAGLLSVGWHINRREKHMQFLETVPSPSEQQRWRTLLLTAYSHWRRSFEDALTAPKSRSNRGDQFADPTVLYHIAHITMHTDIIDLQIFAGSKRLLGRKISGRDHASVVHRMKVWVSSQVSRTAVLHGFKLLRETLIRDPIAPSQYLPTAQPRLFYSCRADPCLYRPWALYLAALTIWAYQQASFLKSGSILRHMPATDSHTLNTLASQYIINCASSDNPERLLILTSAEGCAAVLHILADDFANSEWELLLEASKRLRECGRMLLRPTT